MSVSSWEPDPTGRHQYRWWDGEEWTDQVADDGVQSVDPVTTSEASLPANAVPSPAGAPRDESLGLDAADPTTMISSRGKRFVALLFEIPLFIVTLGIGYIIWALFIYTQGQTPAKQLLKMRVVNVEKRRAASWWSMVAREWLLKGAILIGLNYITWGILGTMLFLASGIMVLVHDQRHALWDKVLKTVVIDDPHNLYKPVPRQRYPPGG